MIGSVRRRKLVVWVLALVCAMRCSKVLKKAEEAKREGGAEA